MATRTVVTVVCDKCETDDLVSTHRVSIDGQLVEVDLCDKDWQEVLETLSVFLRVGRKTVTRKVTKRTAVVEFPGEAWRFSNHSLVRLGERRIKPMEAVAAAENPTTVHPGLSPDTEVRCAGRIKVVVQPKTHTIVTVSNRDEELEAVS